MTAQLGKKTNAVYILPKISRSKGNHVMEFAQLRGNNMKIFFQKNHTQNVMEKPFPDPFLKKQNQKENIDFQYFLLCKTRAF